ncbi:MAG: ZIP family metal transporter [Anaerolineae bacterium]
MNIALLYALVTSIATFVGGMAPLATRLRHLEQRYSIAFAGGAMVAIALFDLIPEMQAHNALALGLGFFGLYVIEKVVVIHTLDKLERERPVVGWTAVIGIAAESFIDGAAIAVSYAAAPALGPLAATAVFIHEIPRGLATTAIVRGAGYSIATTLVVLAVDAGFTPLGALAGSAVPASWLDALLGFAAGTFLYVGAGDLLPEAHRHPGGNVMLATLMGAGLIWLVSALVRL